MRLSSCITIAPVLVAVLAAVTLAAPACGRSKSKSDQGGTEANVAPGPPIDPALASYQTALGALAPLETVALEAVAANTGAKYTDDATLLAALRDTALPKYGAYVDGLAKIAPASLELSAFHEALLASSRAQLALFERLATAVAASDGTAILAINAEQRKLRDELEALIAGFADAHRGLGIITSAPPPPPPP